MMIVDNKFEIGQTLYLKTDIDQRARIVTGITIRPSNLLYELSLSERSSSHYDFELSTEKDLILTTNE